MDGQTAAVLVQAVSQKASLFLDGKKTYTSQGQGFGIRLCVFSISSSTSSDNATFTLSILAVSCSIVVAPIMLLVKKRARVNIRKCHLCWIQSCLLCNLAIMLGCDHT